MKSQEEKLESQKDFATRAFHVALGAPVVAGRMVREYSSKLADYSGKWTDEASNRIDESAAEGEKIASRMRDASVVEGLQSRVDLEKIQDRVERLRDQLEGALETWRDSFAAEGPADDAPKPEANKPAAKSTAKPAVAKKAPAKKAPTKKAPAKRLRRRKLRPPKLRPPKLRPPKLPQRQLRSRPLRPRSSRSHPRTSDRGGRAHRLRLSARRADWSVGHDRLEAFGVLDPAPDHRLRR